jgi:LysM repeat protein
VHRSRLVGGLAGGCAALALLAPAADAAVPHTVVPGETLWSIAAANNYTTRTVAAYNGLSEDAQVYVGQTLQIPTEGEGAAALASAGSSTSSSTASSTGPTGSGVAHTVAPGESLWSIASANGVAESTLASNNGLDPDALLIVGQTIHIPSGSTAVSSDGIPLGTIPSPYGDLYLRTDAASAWNSMRQESLNTYGQDLYPGGPLSAYRTYDQQAQLYQAYLDGTGAPANPPGTSEHNLGIAVDVETPEMRWVVDQIGGAYGWAKVSAPDEWWHITFVG